LEISNGRWYVKKQSSGLVLSFALGGGGGDGGEGLPPPCPGGVLVPIYNALPWG